MYSIIAVTNKHTAKLHHVGSLYILTYDARKLKHKVVGRRLKTPTNNLLPTVSSHSNCAPTGHHELS